MQLLVEGVEVPAAVVCARIKAGCGCRGVPGPVKVVVFADVAVGHEVIGEVINESIGADKLVHRLQFVFGLLGDLDFALLRADQGDLIRDNIQGGEVDLDITGRHIEGDAVPLIGLIQRGRTAQIPVEGFAGVDVHGAGAGAVEEAEFRKGIFAHEVDDNVGDLFAEHAAGVILGRRGGAVEDGAHLVEQLHRVAQRELFDQHAFVDLDDAGLVKLGNIRDSGSLAVDVDRLHGKVVSACGGKSGEDRAVIGKYKFCGGSACKILLRNGFCAVTDVVIVAYACKGELHLVHSFPRSRRKIGDGIGSAGGRSGFDGQSGHTLLAFFVRDNQRKVIGGFRFKALQGIAFGGACSRGIDHIGRLKYIVGAVCNIVLGNLAQAVQQPVARSRTGGAVVADRGPAQLDQVCACNRSEVFDNSRGFSVRAGGNLGSLHSGVQERIGVIDRFDREVVLRIFRKAGHSNRHFLSGFGRGGNALDQGSLCKVLFGNFFGGIAELKAVGHNGVHTADSRNRPFHIDSNRARFFRVGGAEIRDRIQRIAAVCFLAQKLQLSPAACRRGDSQIPHEAGGVHLHPVGEVEHIRRFGQDLHVVSSLAAFHNEGAFRVQGTVDVDLAHLVQPAEINQDRGFPCDVPLGLPVAVKHVIEAVVCGADHHVRGDDDAAVAGRTARGPAVKFQLLEVADIDRYLQIAHTLTAVAGVIGDLQAALRIAFDDVAAAVGAAAMYPGFHQIVGIVADADSQRVGVRPVVTVVDHLGNVIFLTEVD